MLPKVSIIIPTYNRAKYLPRSIESALLQDYPNKEIIISDNASSDDTEAVVMEYLKSSSVKYYRNPTNIGSAMNIRKCVFEYSTGDWLLVLSDDDYLIDKRYISKAINLIKKDNNIVLVFSNYRVVSLYGNNSFYRDTKIELPCIIDGKWLFTHYNQGGIGIGFLTCLFNKRLAIKIDFFHEDSMYSDTEAWLKMLLFGRAGFIKDISAVYSLTDDSDTIKADLDRRLKSVKIIKGITSFAIEHGFEKVSARRFEYRMLKDYYKATLILLLKKGNLKEIKLLLKSSFRESTNIFISLIYLLILKGWYYLTFYKIRLINEKVRSFYYKLRALFL
jgi:glycosyltransferase involved in cell wall biosynthesis